MSNDSKYKRFVSYFQKVTTVGVLTCHNNWEKAEEEAKIIFESKDPEKCFFDETEWELTDTIEYNPDIELEFVPSEDEKAVSLIVSFNKKMRKQIAHALDKHVDELTEADISKFINMSLEHTIEAYK